MKSYYQSFLCRTYLERLLISSIFIFFANVSSAQIGLTPSETAPRLDEEPNLSDFSGMRPNTETAQMMSRVDGFVQREPVDGIDPSQRTEVYFGYDDSNFYAIFLAFDSDPNQIRATLSSRESIEGDDSVELTIDTFNDQRTAYNFRVTPLGIQRDARWTEGRDMDVSWNAAWVSDGELTDEGYMVKIAIPLVSIRFPASDIQTWRIQAGRFIPRLSEESYWPAYSLVRGGRLNQAALISGMSDLVPGNNNQFIPYVFSRRAEALQTNAEGGPAMRSTSESEVGLDAKFVFRDSWVLDMTLNPDFSQVESDLPQVTVNERFEVQFPEQRPFFIENADFFKPTDASYLFTRRIVDPEAGLRFTGRQNGWGFGAMLMNDKAPGLNRADTDPLRGEKARISVIRGFRDFGGQNRVGTLIIDRQLAEGYNRLVGIDGRFYPDDNWIVTASAMNSQTVSIAGGRERTGLQRDLLVERRGRTFSTHLHWVDTAEDFVSQLGFQNRWYRADTEGMHSFHSLNFYPEGSILDSWGPRISASYQTDKSGVKIYSSVGPSLNFNFSTTQLSASFTDTAETLRPIDFAGLPNTRVYDYSMASASIVNDTLSSLTFDLQYQRGTALNIVPPLGQLPEIADTDRVDLSLLWRPTQQLRIDNTYLKANLDSRNGVKVFENEIIRSSWNYQFTKEISLRLISQYEKTDAGPDTRLQDSENLNFDVLLRYVINPLSAFYVGFNTNQSNFEIVDTEEGREMVLSDNLNKDGQQLFVKLSYLFQR
ncbi:MAG: DUF5916 domain-containing protein [Pseudohongiellaceae bacterium]